MPSLKALALCILLLFPVGAGAAERALVLPLQPGEGASYDGLGPAVQNVIENLLALHPGLEETYLMRHMQGPFPTAGDLQSYMLGKRSWKEPLQGAVREGARYVLGGVILPGLAARVWILDVKLGRTFAATVPIDPQSGLVTLRRSLMEFLGGEPGLPFPLAQAAKALVPNPCSAESLRSYGLSYGSYMVLSHLGRRAYLDKDLSRRTVDEAPGSYLAANMHGWVLYASRKQVEAEEQFRKALALDPDGVDSLDGMMQCAMAAGGIEAATPWALRKAKARGADTGPDLSEMHMLLGSRFEGDKNAAAAARHYRTAAALDPESELPPLRQALVLHRLGHGEKALAPVDARLSRPMAPAVRATLLNFKARIHRWNAQELMKKDRPGEERAALAKAVESLKASPLPDLHEYSLTIMRLAHITATEGSYTEAGKLLALVKPEPHTDPLLVESMAALFAVLADAAMPERQEATGEGRARACLDKLAERMRACEPAPREVFDVLAQAFAKLGNAELADSIRRLREARTGSQGGDQPG
jgi:hypothetical protein